MERISFTDTKKLDWRFFSTHLLHPGAKAQPLPSMQRKSMLARVESKDHTHNEFIAQLFAKHHEYRKEFKKST